eukprot:scaffold33947_cov63-Phaeocystis_antarctica.AAC.3
MVLIVSTATQICNPDLQPRSATQICNRRRAVRSPVEVEEPPTLNGSEHKAYDSPGRRRPGLREARSGEDQQPAGGLRHAGAHSTMTTARTLAPRAHSLP